MNESFVISTDGNLPMIREALQWARDLPTVPGEYLSRCVHDLLAPPRFARRVIVEQNGSLFIIDSVRGLVALETYESKCGVEWWYGPIPDVPEGAANES